MSTTTTLAGATFRQAQLKGIFERTKGNKFKVIVMREPDNAHDAKALVVVDATEQRIVGYIPRSEQKAWSSQGMLTVQVDCCIHLWQAKGLYLAKLEHFVAGSL